MCQTLDVRPQDTRILHPLDLSPLFVRPFFTPGCKTPGFKTPGYKNFTAPGPTTLVVRLFLPLYVRPQDIRILQPLDLRPLVVRLFLPLYVRPLVDLGPQD